MKLNKTKKVKFPPSVHNHNYSNELFSGQLGCFRIGKLPQYGFYWADCSTVKQPLVFKHYTQDMILTWHETKGHIT